MSVAVAIVFRKVHIRVCSTDSSPHQLVAFVGALGIILAIVERIGSHHIKLRFEATVGIVGEIVAHTAGKHLVVVLREALLVGHLVHQVTIVGTRKLQVLVLRQDNQPAKAIVVET